MDLLEVKKPLQVYMPIELFLWVQGQAKEQERSMTWIVNQALNEKKSRDASDATEAA